MHNDRRFLFLPAIASLTGLLFCLWVWLLGGEELCLTDGCSLFQDFSLAGVSLWSAGTALFSVLLGLCLLRQYRLALFCAGTALAADILLMTVMIFTAPCVNCIFAGIAIALTFAALLRGGPARPSRRSNLLLIWGLCCVTATGGILRDMPALWSPLPHSSQNSVQVFFSPSCRACQTLIEQADQLHDAAWFPVAEDSRDIWLIRAMTRHLENGTSLHDAITKAHDELPGLADAPDLTAIPSYRFGLLKPDMLLLQFRLWKNRAHVLAAGSDRLPFVEFKGLPSFLRHETQSGMPTSAPSSAAPDTVIPGVTDFGVAGFCGGENTPDNCKDGTSDPSAPTSPTGAIDTSGMLQ